MELKQVLITNGIVVGAIVEDKGIEKRARLQDVHKLLEKNKITTGAKLINGQVIFDASVLRNRAVQQTFALSNILKDSEGNLIGVELTDGKQIDVKTAWSLAADDRLDGLKAAYMKDIDYKVIMSA